MQGGDATLSLPVRDRIRRMLSLLAAACVGAIVATLLIAGGRDNENVVELQAEISRLKAAAASTPQLPLGAQAKASEIHDSRWLSTDSGSRKLTELVDDVPVTRAPSAMDKVAKSFSKMKANFKADLTETKHTMQTNAMKALRFIEEIGATKYRVHNVRYVFLGIAWIFIITTTIVFLIAEFKAWVIPQYQALQIQVMVMFLLLALTPSLELFISRRNVWLELFEVLLEGHLLFTSTLWLPRILEAIVEKVQRVRDRMSRGITDLFTEDLEKELRGTPTDNRLETEEIDFSWWDLRISPVGKGEDEEALGVPEDYTLKVSFYLLFVVRPVLCVVMVSSIFAVALPKPQLAIMLRACIDFCILWASTSLLSYGGQPLLKKNPTQLRMDRLVSLTAHVLVCVPPFMDATLQWLSPDILLAIQLSDLIHLCIISVSCCIVAANRLSYTAVLSYMTQVMELHRDSGNLARIESSPRDEGEMCDVIRFVLNPLLPLQSLIVPREGWTAICHTICLCIELEESSLSHWPAVAHSGNGLMSKPMMPYETTDKDQELKVSGDLTRRSSWDLVFSDSFTLRVRSTAVNMGVISIFMTLLVFKDEFFSFQALNPWQALGVQIIFGILIWFFAGILLIGNNIFRPRYPFFTISSRVWVAIMMVSFYWNIEAFMHPNRQEGLELSFEEVILGPDFRMWIHLVMAILCLFLMLVVLIQMRLPERYADFIVHELQSLMYSRALLEPEKSIDFPKLQEKVQVRRGGNYWEDATVGEILGDGNYRVLPDRWHDDGADAISSTYHQKDTRAHWLTVKRKDIRVRDENAGVTFIGGSAQSQRHLRMKNKFMKMVQPLLVLPPVLMLSMVMSLVVVTAFSAVMADSATRVFLVVDEMHDLAIIGGAYFRQRADCNVTGYDLASSVDLDKSGSVSHKELPLYALLTNLPASLRGHFASDEQIKLLWPTKNEQELRYSEVASMLCNVEEAGKYRFMNTHGLGGLIRKAKKVNLTGPELLDFYGGAISSSEARRTLYENLAIVTPTAALDLSKNIVDIVWPNIDMDGSGALNSTEAQWLATGLNFIFGRAPILLSLVPCPHEEDVHDPAATVVGSRRLGPIILPLAQMIHLTDVNHDQILQRKEWLMLVAAITWIPGLAWGKKFLTETFDFFAGPYKELKWNTVDKLSEALDAFIQTASDLPKMIRHKRVSAKYFIPYLDDDKNGQLSRSEMHGFESYLTEHTMAARANAVLDTAFRATDADGDGVLAGAELEAGVFGESLRETIGAMVLRAMEKSVASTPANCKDLRKKAATAPARSLIGRILLKAVGLDDARPESSAWDSDGQESWAKAASRHLLLSAPILDVNASTSVEKPTNVYELASQVKARAGAAKQGIESTLDFLNTLQEVTEPDDGSIIDGILKEIASDRIRSCIRWITIGVMISNIVSDIFSAFVCYRLVVQFNVLTDYFRKGRAEERHFKGNTYVKSGSLRNSFSASAYLPGTMWFTIILGWIACFSVFNAAWTGAVVGFHFPSDVMAFLGPYLKYMSGTLLIMLFLRYAVMDCFLTRNGFVTHPRVFTLVWMMLVVINFVIGVSLAVLRVLILWVYTLISGCFLHYSLLDEKLLRGDHGYFAFLSMAYTYYERHNPVKSAFVTVLMPQVHKLYGPKKHSEDDHEEAHSTMPTTMTVAQRRQRAKNRFALALTLARNPELVQNRREKTRGGLKRSVTLASGSSDEEYSEDKELLVTCS